MIPVVRLGDVTFGTYLCFPKTPPVPAMGMVTIVAPTTFANNLGVGQMTICISAQPGCPRTPFNLGMVGSPTMMVDGGLGILRMGDPVIGQGAGGVGNYISGSADMLSG